MVNKWTELNWTELICFKAQGCGKIGWPIQDRELIDIGGWTMVSVDQPFTCDGKLVEWRYQVKASNPFRAIVWRPVTGSDNEFQIVGINDIGSSDINTPITYTVPENERIAVKAGDLIGWSFDTPSLAYDMIGNDRIFWKSGLSNLDINQIHTIDFNDAPRDMPRRKYSIQATIESFEAQGTYTFTSGKNENTSAIPYA